MHTENNSLASRHMHGVTVDDNETNIVATGYPKITSGFDSG